VTLPSPRPRALALVLVAVLTLAACDSAEQPAAEVDDARITNEQLVADQKLFDFLTSISGSPCGQPAEDETQDAACARLTLTNLIQEELVKGYAGAHELSADPDTVADVIGQVEQSVGGPEALDQQLAQSDLTRAGFEAFATRLLLFNSVQTAVGEDEVTDERVQEVYDQNRAQYTTVEVAHILLPTRAEAEDVAREATPKRTSPTPPGALAGPGPPRTGQLGHTSRPRSSAVRPDVRARRSRSSRPDLRSRSRHSSGGTIELICRATSPRSSRSASRSRPRRRPRRSRSGCRSGCGRPRSA
jgi:hypothetical protein